MIINNKSWHYKLYEFTYSWAPVDSWLPERTNLCQYVQRIIWMGLVMSVFCYGIFLPVWFTIIYLIITPFALLFGKMPYAPWDLIREKGFGAGDLEIFTQYSLPTIKFDGLVVRVLPFFVLLPIGLVALEVYGWSHHIVGTLIVHLTVLFLASMVFGIIFFVDSKTETAVVARSFISAKKKNVCPLVEFRDAPSSDDEA